MASSLKHYITIYLIGFALIMLVVGILTGFGLIGYQEGGNIITAASVAENPPPPEHGETSPDTTKNVTNDTAQSTN